MATVELCSCYRERQFMKYNAAGSFSLKERNYTFKNAVIDEFNRGQFEAAVGFVRDINKHLEEGTWLYIFGDDQRVEALHPGDESVSAFGTGKTFLMQCIANALAVRKIPALYVTEESLFGDIKATYNKDNEESEAQVLDKYYWVPVLMIDDIFTAPYKEWAEGKLFSILDERQKNNKVTIMTSNYATGRVKYRLPLNGAKIASRITGQAMMIEMIGPDRRPQRRHGEPA